MKSFVETALLKAIVVAIRIPYGFCLFLRMAESIRLFAQSNVSLSDSLVPGMAAAVFLASATVALFRLDTKRHLKRWDLVTECACACANVLESWHLSIGVGGLTLGKVAAFAAVLAPLLVLQAVVSFIASRAPTIARRLKRFGIQFHKDISPRIV